MSQSPPVLGAQTASPRGPRSGCFKVAIGCAVVIAALMLILLATCIGGSYWLSRSAEVPREGARLVGEEDLFVSLYLDKDDEALLELTARVARRLGEIEEARSEVPIPMGNLREMQSRQGLGELLPIRLQLSMEMLSEGGEDDLLLRASFSGNYRQFWLMFKGAKYFVAKEQNARQVQMGEHDVLIIDMPEGELAMAFVGNEFLLGAPEMLAQGLARDPGSAGEDQPVPERPAALLSLMDHSGATFWGFFEGDEPWMLADGSGQTIPIACAAMTTALVDADRLGWKLALEPEVDRGELERLLPEIQQGIERRLKGAAEKLTTEITSAEVIDNAIVIEGHSEGLLEAVDQLFAK